MTTNKIPRIPSSEITPETLYINRRRFMKLAVAASASALLAACGIPTADNSSQNDLLPPTATGFTDEFGDPANALDVIASYNNYYEFTMDKTRVAELAKDFPTSPWQVEVGGLVNKPRVFDIEDLRAFPQEERIYRLRCVEGWSMVIPWLGFPLSLLLKVVEPMSSAKYVRFVTAEDKENMPGLGSFFPFPYNEGLRLDEAYHDLTLLVTGLYGQELLPQNGAPLRLAVPWKYGFKSGKSIVKIELTESMPATFWSTAAAEEYGFYANVNPDVPHPRWSQATERRIGETSRRETLLFNGYSEQVGQLYSDMNLNIYY